MLINAIDQCQPKVLKNVYCSQLLHDNYGEEAERIRVSEDVGSDGKPENKLFSLVKPHLGESDQPSCYLFKVAAQLKNSHLIEILCQF